MMNKDNILNRLLEMSAMSPDGGMVGWLIAATKSPEYLYGEITGYYCSLLAYIYSTDDKCEKSLLVEEMQRQTSWLFNEYSSENGLITRKYYSTKDDWKNKVTFLFDIAMIIRGLRSICELNVVDKAPETLELYIELLAKFRNNEALSPFLPPEKSAELPDKWATRVDIHYLKIIAALFGLEEYRSAVARYVDYYSNNTTRQHLLDSDTHPLMYYYEGWLMLRRRNLTTKKLDDLNYSLFMEFLDRNYGKRLTGKWSTGEGEVRSDIVAQAMRITAVLCAEGLMTKSDYQKHIESLNAQLADFYLDGYMCYFKKDVRNNYYNTWSAMFSYQALDYIQHMQNNLSLGNRADHII